MIEVQSLNFSYGKRALITDISFNLNRGSFTTLIGPNGSGKTTLLKLIANLLQPNAGSVHFDRDAEREAQPFFWLPSTIDLPFAYSVAEVIEMLLVPWETPKRSLQTAPNIEEIIASAKISVAPDRIFNSLSAGEQHRVALATAMASDAAMLILDEPCANLDIAAAMQTLETVRLASQAGRTVILTLHDLHLAFAYCTEFLLLPGDGNLKKGSRTSLFSGAEVKKAFSIEYEVIERQGKEYLWISPGTHEKEM